MESPHKPQKPTCVFVCVCVCVCVCVLVYATLWGPNVPTGIVKPEMFDIVGKKNIKNSKWCLSESVTMQTGFL